VALLSTGIHGFAFKRFVLLIFENSIQRACKVAG
jgi:hypothetical protein